ncbi:hypothetical protein MRB53_006122 [Persea americana]|uniref:Uncharacterized protein n=1 Tax=Persea americana TaxID=3435 RepID=A0ACC2MFH1_PERAE|nr:hypothetical protein MRB53_006122 [Persea americana]
MEQGGGDRAGGEERKWCGVCAECRERGRCTWLRGRGRGAVEDGGACWCGGGGVRGGEGLLRLWGERADVREREKDGDGGLAQRMMRWRMEER